MHHWISNTRDADRQAFVRLASLLVGSAGIIMAATYVSPAGAQDVDPVHAAAAPDPLRDTIAARLRTRREPSDMPEQQRRLVRALYDPNDASALWVEGERLTQRAVTLIDALTNAHSEGLRLERYRLGSLRSALATLSAAGALRLGAELRRLAGILVG